MGQYFYCLLTVISTHQVRIIDRITESCLLEVTGLSNLSVPDPDLDPGSLSRRDFGYIISPSKSVFSTIESEGG